MGNDEEKLLGHMATQGEGDLRGSLVFTLEELVERLGWGLVRTKDAVDLLQDRGLLIYEEAAYLGSTPIIDEIQLTPTGRRQHRSGGASDPGALPAVVNNTTNNTTNVTAHNSTGVLAASGGTNSQTNNITYRQVLNKLLQEVDDSDSIPEETKKGLKESIKRLLQNPVTDAAFKVAALAAATL